MYTTAESSPTASGGIGVRELRIMVWLFVAYLAGAPSFSAAGFSVDPLSPEVPGIVSPADIIPRCVGFFCFPVVLGPSGAPADLGLVAADNIDAFSAPVFDITPVPPPPLVTVNYRYSITRGSVGVHPVITAQTTAPPGNGAAGDVFRLISTSVSDTILLSSDATGPGLTPLPPVQSDLDALAVFQLLFPVSPAFFSVDPATGPPANISVGVAPYGAASVTVFALEAALGLVPGDDINALCVKDADGSRTFTAGDEVAFSLAAGSPTLIAIPADPSDVLFKTPGPGLPIVFIDNVTLGLLATDDLNALQCSDPPCGDGIIELPEVCDDGNNDDGDGCSSVCQVEPGFICPGEPSVCTPFESQIPVLSGWGLLVLATLFLGTSFWMIRRKLASRA